MKKVYFVQANMTYGKAVYLPYATGCLAAYAWQFETIRSAFEIGAFFYERESPDRVLAKMEAPYLVAFSCYTWTFEYNKVLAQKIKARYPQCRIVFGGHNVSQNNDILSDLPYVDFLIYGEGERPFKALLEYAEDVQALSCVPNIAFRKDGKTFATPRKYEKDLQGYLSPYLLGYFDDIIAGNPETEFCAVIETNRGCPYHCAYCDWCYATDIRQFPLKKIQQEIVWCAEHRVEYIFCADSNFGILKRDLDIAKFVVQVKEKYGYPHIFNTCFAKNSNDTVFEISKLFYDSKTNKAATLAYQTVCETALENVHRKNFTMDTFAQLVQKYNEQQIPTYTEMILGLPGETYESFTHGLCDLIEAGQQSALTVYYCQVYCNSLMGSRAYREKHGIQTAHVPLNYLHSTMPAQEDITEYTDLVVATKTMPFGDMLRAILFCTCLQCFHHIGLLQYFAVYVRKACGVRYHDFYTKLLEYIFSEKDSFLYTLFSELRRQCSDFSNGEWSYYNEKFGEIGWFLEEGVFMEILCRYEDFWAQILPFLRSFPVEKDVLEELLRFQKFVIRLPGQEKVTAQFRYDFCTYFHRILSGEDAALQRRENRIEITIPDPVYTWQDYARKVMLFAKRRGDTVLIRDKRNVKILYTQEEKS